MFEIGYAFQTNQKCNIDQYTKMTKYLGPKSFTLYGIKLQKNND